MQYEIILNQIKWNGGESHELKVVVGLLVVQWLRLATSNAGDRVMGLIPDGGTKIPHAVWSDLPPVKEVTELLKEKFGEKEEQ